jgi:hypothetical protein
LVLKNVRWKKIKNTGLAMSVGLLVVRLKFGLYVGHLSKCFNSCFFFLFLWRVVVSVTIAANYRIQQVLLRKALPCGFDDFSCSKSLEQRSLNNEITFMIRIIKQS